MSTAAPAIPAATLVILRDGGAGVPEILMVERSRDLAFAGGALVFPGGRVDPGDHVLADGRGDEAAARIAAIRETLEEAGLAIGMDGADGAALRAAQADGSIFSAALAATGAVLRPGDLVPLARWRPDRDVARLFDTRFYLARAPAGLDMPVADGTETARAFWTTADAALAQVRAGRAAMIFPTLRTVERLALHATVDAAIADARARPIRTITPWTEMRDGAAYLCIPEDLGYPVTAQRLDTVSRG